MTRFHGLVGFTETEETKPGVWTEKIVEKPYYGDVIKESVRFERGVSINDTPAINHRISIMADPYAVQHFSSIRFVEWLGERWKVSLVEAQRPRLLLSIGDIYNG